MSQGSTVGLVAEVLGARVLGDPDTVLTGVTHDSRRVGPGSLFCCVAGLRFDGHDFAAGRGRRGRRRTAL